VSKQRFGRYTVVGELGRGAMGTVYRAVDPLIEREVAVKTLLPNLAEHEQSEVRERFLREARSAGRLNHPNIVTIFDVGEQDGVVYIAMELLRGSSLAQLLREPDRLPFERIADIVAQVADALDHASRAGVVHRDVKPANIMVGDDGRVKLTDFGIARMPSSSMTQTGQALGSPKYMSPEQVLGLAVDPRSDIFSLGAVLYEMLVRRTPFERPGEANVYALLHRIAGEAYRPVRDVDPSVPQVFDEILARALAKKPEDRYVRADEMAAALRRAFAAIPGAATLPGSATQPAAARNPDVTARQLLADLEQFSSRFEAEEAARVRAEEEARRQREEELARWAAEQARKRLDVEREQAQTDAGQGAARRSSALELLRQKASARGVVDDRAARAEAVAKLDERLRAAFAFLSEFVTHLNEARPVSEAPYGISYLGEVPRAVLSDGFTDYRSREIDGRSRFDFVTLKFKVSSVQPVSFTLTGKDVETFRERLERLKIKYDFQGKANDFGQITRATFTVSGPFPCGAVLRADYDNPSAVVALENVRRFGARQARIPLESFTDELLDEFGTYVLGADDAFDRWFAPRR